MLDDLLDNKNVLSISVIYNKSPYRKATLLITFYGLKFSFMYLSFTTTKMDNKMILKNFSIHYI